MTVKKLSKRRRPFGGMFPSDFFDMEDFFDNRLWSRTPASERFWNGRSTSPALNIKETDKHFEVELSAPGFDKKDFKITVENGYLNIAAEKSFTEEEKEEEYSRREFRFNSFERSLALPENVEDEEIHAKYTDGILRFKLLKRAEGKPQNPKVIKVT